MKEATVRGFHGRTMYGTWELSERLLLSRKITIGPIVTHRLSLADYERAFELLRSGEACKVILRPETCEDRG